MKIPDSVSTFETILSLLSLTLVPFFLWLMAKLSYRPRIDIRPANEIGSSLEQDRTLCYCDSSGRGFAYIGVRNKHKRTISIDGFAIHFNSPISLAPLPDDDHFESKISDIPGYENSLCLIKPLRLPHLTQWQFAFSVKFPTSIRERTIQINITSRAHWTSWDSAITQSVERESKFTLKISPISTHPELVTDPPFRSFMTQEVMISALKARTTNGVAAYSIRDTDGHIEVTLDPT